MLVRYEMAAPRVGGTKRRSDTTGRIPAGRRQALPLALGMSAVAVVITAVVVFGFMRPAPTPPTHPTLIVVENWFEELTRLVPTN